MSLSATKILMGSPTEPEPTDDNFNLVTGLCHFDGSNGGTNATFTDSSGNSHSMTRNGHTTQGTFTPFSADDGKWGVYFDGSDYTSIAASSDFNILGDGTFTVEFFSFVNSYNASYADHAGVFNGVSAGWLIYQNGVDLDVYINGSAVVSATRPSSHAWHHIALTRDGTTLRLFIDGTSVSTSTASLGSDQSQPLRVGGDTGGGRNGLDGYISNFRLIKGTALYTSNFTAPTTSLTAVTNTEALICQSNNFKDNSTNNASITIGGTAKVKPFSPFAPSTSYNSGNNGGSAYFDGTGDYLSITNESDLTPGTGDFTIECWVYFSSSTTNQGIFQLDTTPLSGSTYIAPVLFTGGGAYAGRWATMTKSGGNQSLYADSSDNPVVGVWYHTAVVRTSGTIKVFVNGAQVISDFTDSTDFTDRDSITVGSFFSSSYDMTGYISGFRYVKGTAVYTSAFTPPTAPPTAVTNTELLLNFTNGSIIDNSKNSDIGVFGSAALSTSQKKIGTASLLLGGDSDTDFLVLNAQEDFAGPFTIECWARADDTGIGYMWCVGQYQFECGIDGDNLRTYSAGTGYTNFFTSGEFTVNNWHHVAVVRDTSNVVKMYLNGTASSTTFTYSSAYAATNSVVIIGGEYGSITSIGHGWDGYIDEFRISRFARYTSNFTPSTDAFANK